MKNRGEKLTFPISDTISGPGTYEGTIVMPASENNNAIPAVETADSEDTGEIGHGTAKDVTSTTDE